MSDQDSDYEDDRPRKNRKDKSSARARQQKLADEIDVDDREQPDLEDQKGTRTISHFLQALRNDKRYKLEKKEEAVVEEKEEVKDDEEAQKAQKKKKSKFKEKKKRQQRSEQDEIRFVAGEEAQEDDEEEEKKKFDFGDELNKIYADGWGRSIEKHWVLWSLIKTLMYFLGMLSCFYISLGQYDKKLCYVGQTQTQIKICLRDDPLGIICHGYEDSKCADLLKVDKTKEGCLKTYVGSYTSSGLVVLNYTDYIAYSKPEFVLECQDPYTCTDADEASIKTSITLIGFIFLVMMILEALLSWALLTFSEKHSTDFSLNPPKQERFLIMIAKIVPRATQIGLILNAGALAYMILQFDYIGQACQNLRTTVGAPSEFPEFVSRCRLYIVATIVISAIVGTYFRKRKPLRGEIYRPVPEIVKVYFGLDCADINARPDPKCCPDFFGSFRGYNWTMKTFCLSCSRFIEILSFPILKCGVLYGMCCRNRHVIGP